MTSSNPSQAAYVWIWLPLSTDPVVAGKLTFEQNKIWFNYGKSYLDRHDAIPIHQPELPLRSGIMSNSNDEELPRCLRDAAPDAWGRRVILNQLFRNSQQHLDDTNISELTYLLNSGSDRIGALDFQISPTKYTSRHSDNADLGTLMQAAEMVENGVTLPTSLAMALQHGTSIGGARPKAMLTDGGRKLIAKFAASTDIYNIIKAEFVAMKLASLCGLNVAHVSLTQALGKDILLVERFDREHHNNSWSRKLMLSALTILGLNELEARYASYQDFTEIIRHQFQDPEATLIELFNRLVFNILCSNTDDHARNHAAFWNGEIYTLTPAYDICPMLRSGGEASQAMIITDNDRSSRLITAVNAAHNFLLSKQTARSLIDSQIEIINDKFDEIAETASLSKTEYNLFKHQLIMKDYAFEGY